MTCRFLDDPAAPFHGAVELFFFRLQDVLDDREVIPELGVLGHVLDVHVHNFGQRGPDIQVLHHAQRPSEYQAGKVSTLDVRGNDPVPEHEGQAAGVVCDRVDLLHGLHDGRKLVHGHPDV